LLRNYPRLRLSGAGNCACQSFGTSQSFGRGNYWFLSASSTTLSRSATCRSHDTLGRIASSAGSGRPVAGLIDKAERAVRVSGRSRSPLGDARAHADRLRCALWLVRTTLQVRTKCREQTVHQAEAVGRAFSAHMRVTERRAALAARLERRAPAVDTQSATGRPKPIAHAGRTKVSCAPR